MKTQELQQWRRKRKSIKMAAPAICENSFDSTVRGVEQRGAVADGREDEECAEEKARGGVTGWEGKCCCRERGEPRKRTGVVADDGGDDDDEAKGEAAEGADVEQRECSATARSSSERAERLSHFGENERKCGKHAMGKKREGGG